MESRQSLVLCIIYGLFLVLGAVVFMFLEYEVTETTDVTEPPEWSHLKELALREEPPADEDEILSLATWLPRACQAITNHTIASLVTPGEQAAAVREVEYLCPYLHEEVVTIQVTYPWSFIDALYFSMTVITTIGYGHISPSLAAGRIVCIFYSLVGIPLTGILLAWTSEFFGEQLFKLFKSKIDAEKQHSHGIIALATTIYIAIGFVVFIFVPGAVFMFLEDWTYIEGIYFAYITLTTIGFGDFVTGKAFEGSTLFLYQICVIVWIMIGLGYWVMVANFITKALKSKRLQSSVMRSAEEMKKIMQQMGMKNHDPTFLRQHSKATVNLMLQLSNIIAVQGGAENNGPASSEPSVSPPPDSQGTPSTAGSPTSSPPISPMGIPGISALFGVGLSRTPPLSQLMGPMRNEEYGGKNNEEYATVTVRNSSYSAAYPSYSNMVWLRIYAAMLFLSSSCAALHCISCTNCHEELGMITECDNNSIPVCMKVVHPYGESRMCAEKDHCGLGAFERFLTTLSNLVSQAFSDTDCCL